MQRMFEEAVLEVQNSKGALVKIPLSDHYGLQASFKFTHLAPVADSLSSQNR